MPRNIFEVINTMMDIIPKNPSTLEFARALTKIGDDSIYTAPEAMNIHWQRLTDCINGLVPKLVGTTPLWQIQIMSLLTAIPAIELFRRGVVAEPSPGKPEITLNRNAVSILLKVTLTKDRIVVKVPAIESDVMVDRAMKFAGEIAACVWKPVMHSLRGTFTYMKPAGGMTVILRSDDKTNQHFFMEKSYWKEPHDY